jgi:hypothetical protein
MTTILSHKSEWLLNHLFGLGAAFLFFPGCGDGPRTLCAQGVLVVGGLPMARSLF